MGNIELVDQVTVVKHLAKQGLVDLARVRQCTRLYSSYRSIQLQMQMQMHVK